MKIKRTRCISIRFSSDFGVYIDLNRAKTTFHKMPDGSLEIRAAGLRNGRAKIIDTVEELRSQIKRLKIISEL